MDTFITAMEILGTVAFAISGAMTALHKNMDIFGVSILGLTTAVGGGVIRDILIGHFPPAMFVNSIYTILAVCVSVILFIPRVRKFITANYRLYDTLLLLTDSVGLGIFSVYGVKVAISASYGDNLFFTVFLGTVTGVGGGLLRDIFAGNTPYIFIKHIYACAAIAGALLSALMWGVAGEAVSILSGASLVVLIRLMASRYRWNLPKAKDAQMPHV